MLFVYMGSGRAAYPDLETVKTMADFLGGSIAVRDPLGQWHLAGDGHLLMTLSSCTSTDGEGRSSGHWEILQSWLPVGFPLLGVRGTGHVDMPQPKRPRTAPATDRIPDDELDDLMQLGGGLLDNPKEAETCTDDDIICATTKRNFMSVAQALPESSMEVQRTFVSAVILHKL